MSQLVHPQHHAHRASRVLAATLAALAVAAAAVTLPGALDGGDTQPSVAVPADQPSAAPGVRYDGGPEEGAVGAAAGQVARSETSGVRFGRDAEVLRHLSEMQAARR